MDNIVIFESADQYAFLSCLIKDDCPYLIDTYRDMRDFLIVYTKDCCFYGIDKPLKVNDQTILCLEEDVIPFENYSEAKHFLETEFLNQIADGRP